MSSDLDVIKRIIDAFERSDWAEIDVQTGSLRIRLSVDAGDPPSVATERAPDAASPTTASDDETDEQVADVAGEEPADGREDRATESDRFAGAHLVAAPSPGIFWRSPHPGAPPFADVGHRVAPTTTLCIVEIMKLMTHVKSAVSGTVVHVFVDDGARVDQGEPLFAIAPEP